MFVIDDVTQCSKTSFYTNLIRITLAFHLLHSLSLSTLNKFHSMLYRSNKSEGMGFL